MAGVGLSSWVGWAKTKLLVDQATSTDDEPTPIYVLDEVVAALAGGDARAGVDAVCARLGHRSPVVKLKALKLAAHIGRRGSPELRRGMARQSSAVRELLHFRCDPDPFKGDTVWRRVQEGAQEALAAIHGEPEAAAQAQGSLGGRIRGFGSDASGGGGGQGGMTGFGGGDALPASTGRMVGFGSDDVLQSGMQAVGSGMRSLGSKAGGLLQRQDGYSSSQLDGGGAHGGAVGGWAAPAALRPIMQAGPSAPAGGGGAAAAPAAASAGGEGAAEQRLVDRVCTPAGLRAAPGRDDLQAFVDGLSSLDGAAVARLLERKLEAGPWQATLRALCAIEAVAERGSSEACGRVAVAFQARPDAVRRAADSPQASVRQRARALLALLGADGGGRQAAAEGQQGQQGQPQLFTEDLLGDAQPAGGAASAAADLHSLLGEPAAGPAVAAAAPTAGSSASTAVDLLAGLDVGGGGGGAFVPPAAAPAPQRAAAADPFAGMLLGGQPAAAGPTVPDLDLLGGLSLQPAAAAAATPPAAAPAAPQLGGGGGGGGGGALGDLLGGLSLGPAPAAPLGGPPQQQAMQAGGFGLGMPGAVQGTGGNPAFGQQAAAPWQGLAQPSPFLGVQPGLGPPVLGGSSGAQHGRQPSLNGGHLSMLGSSGIIDSPKDGSFSFVDGAIAAARRKK